MTGTTFNKNRKDILDQKDIPYYLAENREYSRRGVFLVFVWEISKKHLNFSGFG